MKSHENPEFSRGFSIPLGKVPGPRSHGSQDTPGQIEVFNWSASGQIICDALAVTYPTVICYVSLGGKMMEHAPVVDGLLLERTHSHRQGKSKYWIFAFFCHFFVIWHCHFFVI